MVKSDLVVALNDKFPGLQRGDVEAALKCMLAQMAEALANGTRIEVRGFGSFEVRQRPPRHARNPKTGEAVSLASTARVHFKPGKEMRDRVNALRGQCRVTE